MALVFNVNLAAKKAVSKQWFLRSVSGRVVIVVTVLLCLMAFASYPLSASLFMTTAYGAAQPDPVMAFALPGFLLICALLCVVCGYRQITVDTAMRVREVSYMNGDRLVYTFKISNDLRPQGLNVVSIGLASSSVRVRGGVAIFTGDVLAAYITDWHEGATVPLNLLAPMSKPFKLGLYFEPDLLETIRPLVGHWEN